MALKFTVLLAPGVNPKFVAPATSVEKFEEVVVGRELKMIALEREIERLKQDLEKARAERGRAGFLCGVYLLRANGSAIFVRVIGCNRVGMYKIGAADPSRRSRSIASSAPIAPTAGRSISRCCEDRRRRR